MKTISFAAISLLALLVMMTCPPAVPGSDKSGSSISERKREQALRENKRAAQEAMARDAKTFRGKELRELETEYQVINDRYRDPEITDLLKAFLGKWDKGNRVGCSKLYLAKKSRGAEREALLRECITEFSDCYYLNGCQVGALARLHLWNDLKQAGKTEEADKLLAELKSKFALANTHTGELIIDLIESPMP